MSLKVRRLKKFSTGVKIQSLVWIPSCILSSEAVVGSIRFAEMVALFFSSSKSLWFGRILCSGTVSMNDWERNRRESLFSRAYLAFRSVSSSSDLDSNPGSGVFESSVVF